jgi:phenylacetate-CoA ligase
VDIYGSLLSKALFPAFEAARGRGTVPLLKRLRATEQWSPGDLRDLQAGLLRRLLRHATQHTAHYRRIFEERGLRLDDFTSVGDLVKLPLLDREISRSSLAERTATAPPFASVEKSTSGSSGEPVTIRYNTESRVWRDAIRWRGYGWAGYEIGNRAMHYWGIVPAKANLFKQYKVQLDRALKRDLYVDSTPRDDPSLARAVAELRRFRPHVIVAYANGAGALARYVVRNKLRSWNAIPVLTGAEALVPEDRAMINEAFGPAFDTYGCREVMLIGSECEQHDGMHTSMENMIVELVVSEPDGTMRLARPGETGQVVVTDLHNLACPMIRYVTGDLAVARDDSPCKCGRGLTRIGPIQGRISDTLYDGAGRPVSGLSFSIAFAGIGGTFARGWQVHQKLDRSLVLKVVPTASGTMPAEASRMIREYVAKTLPGAPFTIELVDEIPLTSAGKRRVVVVDKAG